MNYAESLIYTKRLKLLKTSALEEKLASLNLTITRLQLETSLKAFEQEILTETIFKSILVKQQIKKRGET